MGALSLNSQGNEGMTGVERQPEWGDLGEGVTVGPSGQKENDKIIFRVILFRY